MMALTIPQSLVNMHSHAGNLGQYLTVSAMTLCDTSQNRYFLDIFFTVLRCVTFDIKRMDTKLLMLKYGLYAYSEFSLYLFELGKYWTTS